jgi:hypothetical protein
MIIMIIMIIVYLAAVSRGRQNLRRGSWQLVYSSKPPPPLLLLAGIVVSVKLENCEKEADLCNCVPYE